MDNIDTRICGLKNCIRRRHLLSEPYCRKHLAIIKKVEQSTEDLKVDDDYKAIIQMPASELHSILEGLETLKSNNIWQFQNELKSEEDYNKDYDILTPLISKYEDLVRQYDEAYIEKREALKKEINEITQAQIYETKEDKVFTM